MFIEFQTVITHKIELGDDGVSGIEHSVSVQPSGEALALGQRVLFAVAVGGCKSAVEALESGRKPDIVVEQEQP